MNVFIQGMRRSGTTILFDLFWEDRNFDCYYEPLAAGNKQVLGGGSGMRLSVDYFENIRSCRAEFLKSYPQLQDMDALNYGAPRQPDLEFDTNLPEYCQAYIQYLLAQSEHTVIKFTRMYCKVPVLKQIEPNAKFIHIVRDPRSVTASYLFGKNQARESLFPNEKAFFTRRSRMGAWNSYAFSEFLLHTPEYRFLQGCEDFMRRLLLWKYTFRETYDMGKKCFGERYLLLRHEDLRQDPVGTIHSVYQFLERPVPQEVLDWASRHIRPPQEPFAARNTRWGKAFRTLKMAEEFEIAGYTECLDLYKQAGLWKRFLYSIRARRQS